MAIQALKGYTVTTKELIAHLGCDEDGTTMVAAAKTLRAYGLDARLSKKHLSFASARRLLRSGRLLIASTRIFGVPHVAVLSGVLADGTIRIADPSPRGGQYKRFGFSYITVRAFPRRKRGCKNYKH